VSIHVCSNIHLLWGYSPFLHPILPLSVTNRSLGSFDPWVVPRLEDVDSYGASMPLTTIEILNQTIPSASIDTGQQIHPHMECYQPTLLVRVVNSLCSHDFLDTNFPSEEAILEVMDSIENPKDEMMNRSCYPNLESIRFSTMSLDTILGELAT